MHPEIGYNFRITDLQSAVGLVQLEKLPEIQEKKTALWKRYQEQLKDCPNVRFFEPEKEANFIPFRAAILTPNAQALMEHLKHNDIEPRSFFYPLHRQPCFKEINQKTDAEFPAVSVATIFA